MLKIEGYAGLKMDWLFDELARDLAVNRRSLVKHFVEVIFDTLGYEYVRDCVADKLAAEKSGQAPEGQA